MRRWTALAALTLLGTGAVLGDPAMPVTDHTGETVVLLHGVWRRAGSMRRLERALRAQGYEVINETYRSVRRDIVENARLLGDRLRGVEAERVHFVTHSMGGLIVRQLLTDHGEPRLGRVVMIAPPSRGARLADHYSRIPFYSWVMGQGGLQLRTGDQGVGEELPAPPCPFAIIAGSRGRPRGWHPVIPGDDDGTVGVSETYLPGTAAFVTVRSGHTFIMRNRRAIAATLEFLETGEVQPGTAAP